MYQKARNRPIFIAMAVTAVLAATVYALDNGLEATNQESFCISCHAMRETVYREFKQSAHYANASGVRATCADCHVPKPLTAKLYKKLGAIKDVYHTIMGTVDSEEKFNARRPQMAARVWREMKLNDSRACRRCHRYEFMDFREQDKTARKKHKKMSAKNQTCIDCHRGVAHNLPE